MAGPMARTCCARSVSLWSRARPGGGPSSTDTVGPSAVATVVRVGSTGAVVVVVDVEVVVVVAGGSAVARGVERLLSTSTAAAIAARAATAAISLRRLVRAVMSGNDTKRRPSGACG